MNLVSKKVKIKSNGQTGTVVHQNCGCDGQVVSYIVQFRNGARAQLLRAQFEVL